MKILISGGTGLVGTELGKCLVAKGHQLVVVSRNPEQSLLSTPFPHQALDWSDLDAHAEVLFPSLDAVINLAGAGIADRAWSPSYKKILVNSRLDSTHQLVEHSRKYGKNLKAFISTSAVGFYGDQGEQWLNEDSPQGTDFLAQLCGQWE
ncbi:MAG: NAD-dependent epimerase/dehydratase family protein, partial [Bdellovibrionales bacterium]|nr:NAD-dependent epimerase/dehydratase family protein [Bdellovibrionales bacterium]